MPYYVMVNNATYVIECQEADRPADPWIKVKCALDWQKFLIVLYVLWLMACMFLHFSC